MLVGYARVSTQDQNPALQLDELRSAGCEKIFEEKALGAQRERPELTVALAFVRKSDTLVVWKLDRLARSLKQLIETVELLAGRGIGLRSLTESGRASSSFTSSGRWRSSSAPSSASARRSASKPRGPGAGPADGRRPSPTRISRRPGPCLRIPPSPWKRRRSGSRSPPRPSTGTWRARGALMEGGLS